MKVNFGLYASGKCQVVAFIEVPTDDLSVAAVEIANKYVKFKEIMDYHGHPTFLELCEEHPGLSELIDQNLDSVIGDSIDNWDSSDAEGKHWTK